MKKFFRILLIIILVFVLIIAGWWVYNKYIVKTPQHDALKAIPDNSVLMVQTSDLSGAWTEISKSKVWNYLIKNPYFSEINSDIEMLDQFLADNIAADALLSDRSLVTSIHMTSGVDWDMLYVVDLMDMAMVVRPTLRTTLSYADGYALKERKYKEQTIYELHSETDSKEVIYMTMSGNLFIASFTGSLLEKSIDGLESDHWNKNIAFTEVRDNLSGNELFRFFFNFKYSQAFMKSYMTEDSEAIDMIANSLTFSAFDMYLEDELLSFEGYTGVDSVGSYVKALAGVRPGTMSAWKIASDETALYFSMGFEKYMKFYINLTNQYREGNAKDMEDIEDNVRKLEKYLGISIQKNFFNWIGNEIAFIKLRPAKNRRLEDVVVMIKANNISDAKEGLGLITKKIKNRSPVKFSETEYKNFTIFYLARRNLFKIFFGKLFRSLEKPYFTYIEDFVVLSNSPQVLKSMIDDYIEGRTLNNLESFKDFKNEFKGKSNLSVFIRTPQIYENLYTYSTPEDKKAIKENKEFILSFSEIGFQLVTEGDMFKTTFKAKHNPNAINIDKLEKMENEISESSFRTYIDSMKFAYNLSEEILSTDSTYRQVNPITNEVIFEGRIENGHPQGLWKTYYKSGKIKNSVNYEDGLPTGECFFYYDNISNTKKAHVVYEPAGSISIYKEFHENGARKAEILYEDGIPHGDASFFFPTGSIQIEGRYKKGKKHGRWKYYDENGKKLGIERWKNGEKRKELEVF